MKRIAFITCVELGRKCMEAIYNFGCKIEVAFTLNDNNAKSKSGRIYLDDICKKNKTKLIKIDNINCPSVYEELKDKSIDILFIIGWSQIVGKDLLQIPKNGTFGIHPTLLPIGRGRAPIPWAIIKNLKYTGATLFKIDVGVDSGEIVQQVKVKLDKKTTATKLYAQMVKKHIYLIKSFLKKIKKDALKLVPQDHSLASYWPKRSPNDGLINLNSSIYEADRLCRALTKPYPGAYFFKNNKKIRIDDWKISKRKPTESKKHVLNFCDGYLIVNKFKEIK